MLLILEKTCSDRFQPPIRHPETDRRLFARQSAAAHAAASAEFDLAPERIRRQMSRLRRFERSEPLRNRLLSVSPYPYDLNQASKPGNQI